jgi:hypothetical protein
VQLNMQVRPAELVEETRVDVGDDNAAGGADTLAEPASDRAPAASDFQAMPAAADTASLKMVDRSRVKQVRKRREAVTGLSRRIIE